MIKKVSVMRKAVQLVWTALSNGYLTGYLSGRIYTVIGICADCTVGGRVDESVVADAREIAGDRIRYPIVVPSAELENGILSEITAFPTTFFVDSDGNVIKIVMGAKEKREWERIITECCEMAGDR